MTIEAYGGGQRYETVTIDNERERTADEAREIAIKRYPEADRIVMTGRNGMLLHEEYVRRSDGRWSNLYPSRVETVSTFMNFLLRHLFP